jgi:hypothetical protein
MSVRAAVLAGAAGLRGERIGRILAKIKVSNCMHLQAQNYRSSCGTNRNINRNNNLRT